MGNGGERRGKEGNEGTLLTSTHTTFTCQFGCNAGIAERGVSTFLHSLPYPFSPSPPLTSPSPSEVELPLNQLRGLRERCKLLQRSLAENEFAAL